MASDGLRAVEELPHLTGQFPGAITDSFETECSGIVSGKNLNLSKSVSASGTKNIWGFKIDFGSDKAHQNTPLAVAVYGWKRTA